MELLLNHSTTDDNLESGLVVAFKDTTGQHTCSGKIISFCYQDGVKLWNVSGASYTADELKLIVPEIASSFAELKIMVIKHKNFVQVAESLYYYSLEVLPPIWLKNGCFMIDEPLSENLYYVFGEKDGKYYGCICNKNFALNNF